MSDWDIVTLKLPRIAVSQILDAIEIRAEQWEHTQRYLETGVVEDVMAMDCEEPEEAAAIAGFYKQTARVINHQLAMTAA